MALTPSEFKRPTGRLSASWFVDDLDASLAAFIAEAQDLTANEVAQAAWVYHRAYQTLADDRALIAQTVAADDVRETFGDAQIAHWQRVAQDYFDEFTAANGTPVGGPVLQPIGVAR